MRVEIIVWCLSIVPVYGCVQVLGRMYVLKNQLFQLLSFSWFLSYCQIPVPYSLLETQSYWFLQTRIREIKIIHKFNLSSGAVQKDFWRQESSVQFLCKRTHEGWSYKETVILSTYIYFKWKNENKYINISNIRLNIEYCRACFWLKK